MQNNMTSQYVEQYNPQGQIIGGTINAGLDIFNTQLTNQTNKEIAESTNQTNKEISEGINETNKAIAEANIEYQKEYNKNIWEREDNAISRRVADLSKNGISVLADMQGAGAGGTTSAPQNSMTAQGYTAQGYTAQAPNLDFNEMMNLLETKRHNSAQEELIEAQANKTNAEAEVIRAGEERTEEGYEYEKSRRETEEKARAEEIKKIQEEINNLKQNKQKTHYETVKTVAETNKLDQEANFDRRTEKAREEIINQQAILASLTNDRQRAQLVGDWIKNGKEISEEVRAWYDTYKKYNSGVKGTFRHLFKKDNSYEKYMSNLKG